MSGDFDKSSEGDFDKNSPPSRFLKHLSSDFYHNMRLEKYAEMTKNELIQLLRARNIGGHKIGKNQDKMSLIKMLIDQDEQRSEGLETTSSSARKISDDWWSDNQTGIETLKTKEIISIEDTLSYLSSEIFQAASLGQTNISVIFPKAHQKILIVIISELRIQGFKVEPEGAPIKFSGARPSHLESSLTESRFGHSYAELLDLIGLPSEYQSYYHKPFRRWCIEW